MAKAVDQFRPADVTLWGIVALSIWAVAILGANVSALIPPGVYGALHASRLEGSTLNQLRAQVASLEQETARMKRDDNQLLQRFAMNEEQAGDVGKRLGALEASIPQMLEEARASTPAPVDTMETGSIGEGKTLTLEVDGGTVAIQQRPLLGSDGEVKFKPVPLSSTLPPAVAPGSPATGIALGFPVDPETAEAQWQEMLAQAGTMLVGLSPVLADRDGSDGKIIVAGPLVDKASAIELCGRLDEAGVPCEPVPFAGEPLPLLN